VANETPPPRPPAAPRRGGRPSRVEAGQIRDQILDIATALFLRDGYGATSIEAVAKRARISKRTFYHRFPDKAALFAAVVHRIIEKLRPPAGIPLYDGGSLEEILGRLARLMLRAAVAPTALALSRLMIAEAQRFPELAAIAAREGARAEAVVQIAALLAREAESGSLAAESPEFAAEQFIQMVISLPQRRAMGFGRPMAETDLEAWADDCVALCLCGCRARERTKPA